MQSSKRSDAEVRESQRKMLEKVRERIGLSWSWLLVGFRMGIISHFQSDIVRWQSLGEQKDGSMFAKVTKI